MERTRRNGFTLVEIMVCIALLMVTVLAVMGVIANNASVNNMARTREIAINLASQQMERIYRDLPQNIDGYNENMFETSELPSISEGEPARVVTTVTPVADNADLRQVTVQVIWDEDIAPVELQALRRAI